jgi:hypothetical protein
MIVLRRLNISLLFFASLASASLTAQTPAQTPGSTPAPATAPAAAGKSTITLRMIESRTGKLISTTDFLVQINHQQDLHANWVELNEDKTGKLTLPKEAEVLLVHGKYDQSMLLYINCDSEKKGVLPTLGTQEGDHWYSVADILKSGVVTHNGCGSGKDLTKFVPTPGEFVFFVRKLNWHETASE